MFSSLVSVEHCASFQRDGRSELGECCGYPPLAPLEPPELAGDRVRGHLSKGWDAPHKGAADSSFFLRF